MAAVHRGRWHAGLETLAVNLADMSMAAQQQAKQTNEYWTRVYWIRDITRAYWGIKGETK